jgi:hypothetical protein
MNAPFGKRALHGLSLTERTEAMLGHTDWTAEDYYAAGEREFDDSCARGFASAAPTPFLPSNRAEYARKFAAFHCPPAKIRRAAA